jgi:valyl-tRNA synthetase
MKPKPLPDTYSHADTQTRWQAHWQQSGIYAWRNDSPREQTYVIDTPPPTVSGQLHMGHVFSYVQADLIARYQRMKGLDVFYPMGFDDNGLPTERLVEKTHKKRATDYASREEFIAVCEQVSETARKDFRHLFQSLALSVDWTHEYHTISEECRRLSQASFMDLLEKGHIERRLEPMLWDCVDQTAIAQAEIEDKELDSSWNDIWFGVEELVNKQQTVAGDNKNKILIGTTRPELIPACVAIFYHPDDARYQHLRGKHAITPLFGVRVPILEDDTVNPEKGTGIMMCCTFGDEADIEKWRKHKLPTRIVINKYGKLDLADFLAESSHEPAKAADPFDCAVSAEQQTVGEKNHDPAKATAEKLHNKKISNTDPKHLGARQIILQLLAESGDLLESRPIKHMVKCAERSGAPLEILPTPQWFVKVTDKQEALLARARECDWYPPWMRQRIEQWIEGLSWDWCISRQRYYGVPFPVWYSRRAGEEGKILLPKPHQLPVNPLSDLPEGYGADEVTPDADVMDTWATSSLTPQINAGGLGFSPHPNPLPEGEGTLYYTSPNGRGRQGEAMTGEGKNFSALFPADLRPQAHEIIRTWAFYTLVKAHLHNDSIPWKKLMISGWCLAEDKSKMSKSKGNVVTPEDLITQHSTDAVRYWAATSRVGQDTAFSPDLLKIGRKLTTKLWNACKFVAPHLDKLPADGTTPAPETLDAWILARLHHATHKATQAFEAYEYADALRAAEDFFWNDLCDNYLELVKVRVYGDSPASAAATLQTCLDGILRLLAPFVPHVTEELFSHLFPVQFADSGSLHGRGTWPDAANYPANAAAEAAGQAAVELLEAIRKAKSERGVSIKYPIEKLAIASPDCSLLDASLLADLAGAGNIQQIEVAETLADGGITTESGRFTLAITFAQTAEAG